MNRVLIIFSLFVMLFHVPLHYHLRVCEPIEIIDINETKELSKEEKKEKIYPSTSYPGASIVNITPGYLTYTSLIFSKPVIENHTPPPNPVV